ncbi:MAG: HEAT repeat domain-containing protein, partial [Roseimicrobium sp.]
PTLGECLSRAPTTASKAAFADALARIGSSEAVDELVARLNAENDPAVRAVLAQAFDAVSASDAVETLTSALAVIDDPVVSARVVSAVARAANGDTVAFLRELYEEPSTVPGQPTAALTALATIRNPEATAALAGLAHDAGDARLMEAAARGLGSIGTPEALDGIARGLRHVGDTHRELREAMLDSIALVANHEALPWLDVAARFSDDSGLANAAAHAAATMRQDAAP